MNKLSIILAAVIIIIAGSAGLILVSEPQGILTFSALAEGNETANQTLINQTIQNNTLTNQTLNDTGNQTATNQTVNQTQTQSKSFAEEFPLITYGGSTAIVMIILFLIRNKVINITITIKNKVKRKKEG